MDHQSTRELRDETPSGWLELTRNEYAPYLIETLLESPPGHSGKIDNLERRSGVPQSELDELLDLLVALDIISVDGQTYSVNDDSPILMELHHLNSAINATYLETK